MNINDILIERIIELATESGYRESGDALRDAQAEVMLCRFAHAIAAELQKKQSARSLIEAAWCAGYYHNGYTHDSAYAEQESSKFADEVLARRNEPQNKDGTKSIPLGISAYRAADGSTKSSYQRVEDPARRSFEGWATGTYSLNKRVDGTYYESDTAAAWGIWQDALKTASE